MVYFRHNFPRRFRLLFKSTELQQLSIPVSVFPRWHTVFKRFSWILSLWSGGLLFVATAVSGDRQSIFMCLYWSDWKSGSLASAEWSKACKRKVSWLELQVRRRNLKVFDFLLLVANIHRQWRNIGLSIEYQKQWIFGLILISLLCQNCWF